MTRIARRWAASLPLLTESPAIHVPLSGGATTIGLSCDTASGAGSTTCVSPLVVDDGEAMGDRRRRLRLAEVEEKEHDRAPAAFERRGVAGRGLPPRWSKRCIIDESAAAS